MSVESKARKFNAIALTLPWIIRIERFYLCQQQFWSDSKCEAQENCVQCGRIEFVASGAWGLCVAQFEFIWLSWHCTTVWPDWPIECTSKMLLLPDCNVWRTHLRIVWRRGAWWILGDIHVLHTARTLSFSELHNHHSIVGITNDCSPILKVAIRSFNLNR